jgi:hypothetical protein
MLPVVILIAGVFTLLAATRLDTYTSSIQGESVVVPELTAAQLDARGRVQARATEFRASVNRSLLWRAPGWPIDRLAAPPKGDTDDNGKRSRVLLKSTGDREGLQDARPQSEKTQLYVTWDRNAGGLNNQLISAAAAFDTARALNRTVFVRSELLEVCMYVCVCVCVCVCICVPHQCF